MQSGPSGKGGKLKIIIKTPSSAHGGHDDADDAANGDEHNVEYFTPLADDLFATEELTFPVDKLYRKCYWEAKWAEEVGETLKKECREWEELYYKEWLEKEVLLSQVIKSEVDWHDRRQAILSGAADFQVPGAVESIEADNTDGKRAEDAEPANGTKGNEIEVAAPSSL